MFVLRLIIMVVVAVAEREEVQYLGGGRRRIIVLSVGNLFKPQFRGGGGEWGEGHNFDNLPYFFDQG